MRKIVTLSAVAACALATPALAEAEDGDWTGAYGGVSIGYTAAKSDSTVALSGNWSAEAQSLRDFVTTNYGAQQRVDDINFGGQLGYNMQTGGGLVLGIEADVSALSGKANATRGPLAYPTAPTLTYTVTNTIDPKVTYSIKGKVGFATGNTLIYATGGWGWTNADIGAEIVSSGNYHKSAALSHTFNGYEVGGGVEQRLGSNISARLEYVYTDQGHVTYDTGYVTGSAFQSPAYGETFTQNLRMHLIRVGVNFHF